ncbi:peptidoglycan-binding protein [Rhizobium leguminosarum]|uniref:peptidoglycan-binding domain-containing protein n=1 Tax=Rhizobium leguminosarum TaxID=384 RepID=UPI003F9CE7D2
MKREWSKEQMAIFRDFAGAAFCLSIIGLHFWPAAATADSDGSFEPTATLVNTKMQQLPIKPSKIIVAADGAYVIGKADDSNKILKLDVATLEVAAERALDIAAEDVVASSDGEFTYVIGRRGDATTLLVLDAELETLGELALARPLASPSLSLAETNLIVVGGMRTEAAEGAFFVIDAADPGEPVLEEHIRVRAATKGVASAWLDIKQKPPTAFLNSASGSGLVAIGVGEEGEREYGRVSFGNISVTPFTVSALMPNRSCHEKKSSSSFLVTSDSSQILLLAEYDPIYRSLDAVSASQTKLALGPPLPLSKANVSTRLLATSCDQAVVWVGDLNSVTIDQFSVNADTNVIEKVGSIHLPSSPNGLAIDPLGRFALVISSIDDTVTLFQQDGGSISGNSLVRQLQRSLLERGYSIGAIDGEIGSKTKSAVKRFEQMHNLKIDITGDLNSAVEAIQSVPPVR